MNKKELIEKIVEKVERYAEITETNIQDCEIDDDFANNIINLFNKEIVDTIRYINERDDNDDSDYIALTYEEYEWAVLNRPIPNDENPY